jgi:hypothetical protein
MKCDNKTNHIQNYLNVNMKFYICSEIYLFVTSWPVIIVSEARRRLGRPEQSSNFLLGFDSTVILGVETLSGPMIIFLFRPGHLCCF